MPIAKAFEDEQAGKLHIGGCVIMPDMPKWYCKRCDKEFGKIDWENEYLPFPDLSGRNANIHK